MKHIKKKVVWLLTVILTTQNMSPLLPVLADMGGRRERLAIEYATPSDAGKVEEGEHEELENEDLNDELSTPSNAGKNIFGDMPAIGTEEFTKWFFSHSDSPDLWDWFLQMISEENSVDYESAMEWYMAHQEALEAAYYEFSGIALMTSSVGDLWENWIGDMNYPGYGTQSQPYQISSLAQLMGLSEAVASGTSYEGQYFELTQDIDLGGIQINAGSWNPIGWYQNKTELNGDVTHPFKGNFDGCGNTISGLKILSTTLPLKNIGLFGVIDGGSVYNLVLEAEEIYGEENAAVLVGAVKGDAIIRNITVSGSVSSQEDAGGITAELTGGPRLAAIENCNADGIVLNSEGRTDYVGGIVGNAQRAYLVDNTVTTQDGDSNRIQGKGYVGGIAGRMNQVHIYGSYVDGTIGGNGTVAAGGIVGKYESGNLVLARMAGEIGRTNSGNAKREGTFIGTRESNSRFSYGTEKSNNISYLFAPSAAEAKVVFGSNLDNDNTFTQKAHIGYWISNEQKYVTVAGKTETASGDRYFYEELEDAVRYIVMQKLEKEFTSEGYAKELAFSIDHFAPGYMGQPVKGYLVSVPRIDTRNANGTYDTDVATLTAIPSTNNSYYRMIDKNNAAAIAPGATVTVATAPKNSAGSRYQMVTDRNEAGGVKAPTYIDEDGDKLAMNYVNGGTYSFTMPSCDTELNVEYIKVTTQLTVTPAETSVSVIQTRSGDRKKPDILTEVKNTEGVLIARYINGSQDNNVQVQPLAIHAEHNGAGQTADRTVKWSVDDTDLITNLSDTGYTTNDAYFMPNLNSNFIQNIIAREVKTQADHEYREKINNTIYTQNAVATSTTNPDTSANNQPVYGNCKIAVTFQIVDHTTVRVEGMNLNKNNISYTVTRKLTGDRTNPVENITCTEPVILTAGLYPEQPFLKNVRWKDTEDGKTILLSPTGKNTQDCKIAVLFDSAGKENPAWIQNIINEDNSKRAADNYIKLAGSGSHKEKITVTSEDQTHGNVTASCDITIYFETVDETVIHPESVKMSKDKVRYSLNIIKAGDSKSEDVSADGFDTIDLDCMVMPVAADDMEHKPYDREVIWSVSDADALFIDQGGVIIPNRNAQWIKDAMLKAPYKASKMVYVYATAKDNQKVGVTEVMLDYATKCIELKEDTIKLDLKLVKSGSRSNPTYTWSGKDAKKITAITYPEEKVIKYDSSNGSVLNVSLDGMITPVLDVKNEWMQSAMVKPYTASTTVAVQGTDGSSTDVCNVTLNLKVTDNTTSGSSGSGGSSGGGGGSSSKGITAGGPVSSTAQLPNYVVSGTWFENAAGKWLFTDNNRTYANEWAAIHNPYANVKSGQSPFDWFRFDNEGFMVTGWYTDAEGKSYYLNPEPDGTRGRMVTGWSWIDANCYYFNELSNGSRGALSKNTVTKDGYKVDINGAWIVDGVVQMKAK